MIMVNYRIKSPSGAWLGGGQRHFESEESIAAWLKKQNEKDEEVYEIISKHNDDQAA